VTTVMNLRVPQKSENFLTSWVTISFSRRALLYLDHYHISWSSVAASWTTD